MFISAERLKGRGFSASRRGVRANWAFDAEAFALPGLAVWAVLPLTHRSPSSGDEVQGHAQGARTPSPSRSLRRAFRITSRGTAMLQCDCCRQRPNPWPRRVATRPRLAELERKISARSPFGKRGEGRAIAEAIAFEIRMRRTADDWRSLLRTVVFWEYVTHCGSLSEPVSNGLGPPLPGVSKLKPRRLTSAGASAIHRVAVFAIVFKISHVVIPEPATSPAARSSTG